MSATECTPTTAPSASLPTVSAPPAPSPSAALTWRTAVELTLLGAIWGGSFLFMRVAAADFGPFPLVEVRLALGGLILSPFLWQARAQFTARLWLRIAAIAAVNSVIPFALFAWGAERAPAGIGAITNAMTVMFTAVVAFLLYGERIGARRLTGLVAGFVGVAILASGRTAGAGLWQASLAGSTAALMYGFGINFVRRYLAGYPPAAVAAANLLAGALLLMPLAAISWPQHAIGVSSWTSAVLLGVVCTGAAFVLYFRLIGRIGPARASTVTYLIPLFGVVWAWLLLGEPITATMAFAALLILAGVAISQQRAPRS